MGPGAQSTRPIALVSDPSSLRSPKPAREDAVVVVSNRLPFTISRTAGGLDRSASSGGLASALGPVLRNRGGTWVGWPGIDLNPHEELPLQDESYEIKALRLDEREVAHYVHGFSNRTLWPLMHSLPARTRFDRLDFFHHVPFPPTGLAHGGDPNAAQCRFCLRASRVVGQQAAATRPERADQN